MPGALGVRCAPLRLPAVQRSDTVWCWPQVDLESRNELTMDDMSAGLDYMEEDRLDR